MEETINWLDSGIVCAARQERRKEGMPPGMFGSLKWNTEFIPKRKNGSALLVLVLVLFLKQRMKRLTPKVILFSDQL